MNTYLKSIYVHNNYVNSNFLIDFSPQKDKKFKHLIITGENGSGKTTVLRSLAIKSMLYEHGLLKRKEGLTNFLIENKDNEELKEIYNIKFPRVELEYLQNKKNLFIYIPTLKYQLINENLYDEKIDFKKKKEMFLQDFSTKKITEIRNNEKDVDSLLLGVKTIWEKQNEYNRFKSQIDFHIKEINQTSQTNPYENLKEIPRLSLTENFLHFLAFLKKEQVYAIGDGETKKAEALTKRFSDLEKTFQKLFEEPKLKLIHRFNRDNRKFYFEYPDGRQISFNQLSHGHNAVMTMLAEIMLNIEAYREDNPEDVNPKGTVVIDEVESHLHLSLQEKVLPVLISMFPNLQFIIATHSPAVIASIDNVTIYDLSKQRTVNENITGMPYNVLMKSHFGLKNEYSIVVSEKLERVKRLITEKNISKAQQIELEKLVTELQELSPDLALDVYLELERRKRND